MEGVTTAIVLFIFACQVYPHLVKHKPQYYGALGMVLLIILFDAIGHAATRDGGLQHVMYVLAALVQIFTILLLVLCAGGLSVGELAGEVANTVEVIRRGEDKPVLVPLRGEQPKARADREDLPPRRSAVPPGDASIPLD